MNNQEKPTPFTRGQEISIVEVIKKFKSKIEELNGLHQYILNEIKWREKLLKEEQDKPLEKINHNLIISLNAELENLNMEEHKLFDLLLETDQFKNKLVEKHRDIQELSELINFNNELDSILKEINLKDNKK